MTRAKWDYKSIDTIRGDVKDALITVIGEVTNGTGNDTLRLAMIDGMKMLFDALKPYMEETKDEDVQND